MQIKTVSINKTAKLTAYIADPEVGYQMFRDRPGIILAPGGAYLMLATREKEGVALEFLAKGYNVFVLEYSLGFSTREVKESGADKLDTDNRYPKPVIEMFEAIHIVRERAKEYHTDGSRLFLLGFSAGGHLCGSAGVFWNNPEYTKKLSFEPQGDELKATGMILCYPMLNANPNKTLEINNPANIDSALVQEFMYQTDNPTKEQIEAVDLTKHVTKDTVPTFLWHSTDDPVVNPVDSTRFVLALQENGVECEYHLFDHGGHGLALANKVYAHNEEDIQPDIAEWTDMADRWMERQTG
ncbi:MAG: alpha/beta hydrolase [Lachnospiraceae bacterium]|nr:alpha/beta hydrolase [Lachnospiraceae bacterium]